jgi:hypothetical protein
MIHGSTNTWSPSAARTCRAGSGWSVNARIALACVWSTNACGRNACSSASTDGFGERLDSSAPRSASTIAASDKRSSCCSSRSGARRTAGRPAGSTCERSLPLPFTHSTSTLRPSRSSAVVFTDVLPPPCSTSSGSRPSRCEV